MQRIYMKKLMKISVVSAAILSLTALGVGNAHAAGWPIAAGIASGVATGAIVGTAVATAAAPPAYYAYPPPVYAAPGYATVAPAPGPVVVAAAPYYYPRVGYPYYYPGWRVGWGWGRPFYGGHYYHRR
jgi:hypothetical protein